MSVIVVFGLLALIYFVINLALPSIALNAIVKAYLIQPALWLMLIAVIYFLPRYKPLSKINKGNTFIQLALGMAFTQIVFYFIGGLFSSFGKNPSAFTPQGIAQNIFFVGAMLTGMEMSRAWLVTRFGQKHSFIVIFMATLFFTFISIPLGQIAGFQLKIASTNQVISSWFPLLAENHAASLLVLVAGARASLAYRGLLAAFWWLSPILPNLNWALKGFIGVVVPILGMTVISNFYLAQASRLKSRKRTRGNSLQVGWIVIAIVSVLIIWFAVGVLPIRPYVVPSGSMVPEINPGDVVIIGPVRPEAIKLGDIIEYRSTRGNTNIIHRVVKIEWDTQNRFFITKGDANSAPDSDPVPPQAIMGRTIATIPDIGWISIAVKKLFTP